MTPNPRVAALQRLFEHIAQTRMQGVALLNDRLRVQAVGFVPEERLLSTPAALGQGERQAGPPGGCLQPGLAACATSAAHAAGTTGAAGTTSTTDPAWVGVLLTPWFMNLIRLPARAGALPGDVPAPGHSRVRLFGGHPLSFLGAHEEGFGPYESCSLFSPMEAFQDQAAALATARAVMQALQTSAAQAREAASGQARAAANASAAPVCAAPAAATGESAMPPGAAMPSRRAWLTGGVSRTGRAP